MRFGPVLAVWLAGCTVPAHAPADENALDRALDPPMWGNWTAEAGERNVIGPTLLHVERASRVSFVDPAFCGVEDPAWCVPIEGNVRLGWAPSAAGPFSWGPRDTLVTPDEAAFVAYMILRVPSPLVAQAYAANYTVVPVT